MSQYMNILMVLQHCIKSLAIFLCSTMQDFLRICAIYSIKREQWLSRPIYCYMQYLSSDCMVLSDTSWEDKVLTCRSRKVQKKRGILIFFNAIFPHFLIVSLNMYFCPSGKVPTKLFEDSLCKLYFFRSGYFLRYVNIFQKLMKFIPF